MSMDMKHGSNKRSLNYNKYDSKKISDICKGICLQKQICQFKWNMATKIDLWTETIHGPKRRPVKWRKVCLQQEICQLKWNMSTTRRLPIERQYSSNRNSLWMEVSFKRVLSMVMKHGSNKRSVNWKEGWLEWLQREIC